MGEPIPVYDFELTADTECIVCLPRHCKRSDHRYDESFGISAVWCRVCNKGTEIAGPCSFMFHPVGCQCRHHEKKQQTSQA